MLASQQLANNSKISQAHRRPVALYSTAFLRVQLSLLTHCKVPVRLWIPPLKYLQVVASGTWERIIMGKKEKSLRRNSHVVYRNISKLQWDGKKKKKLGFFVWNVAIDSLSYIQGKCVSKRLIFIWNLLWAKFTSSIQMSSHSNIYFYNSQTL